MPGALADAASPARSGQALALGTPEERLEAVLSGLYAWYRSTEPMSGNVRRDRELVPALDALLAETADVRLARLVDVLADRLRCGRRWAGAAGRLALALDFWTWRRLASEGLDDRAAARLMTETVLSRARGDLREASSQRGRRSRHG